MDDTSTLDVGGTINLANNVESLASAKYFLSNNGGVKYQHQKHATIDHDFP
jgi:hypothetical protein